MVVPAPASETAATAAAAADRFHVTQPDGDGGWRRDALGVTMKYDYLGVPLTPALDMSLSLRQRSATARWQACRLRALPHGARGLPPHVLSQVYQALVQPHLEYAAGVWAPPTPATAALYTNGRERKKKRRRRKKMEWKAVVRSAIRLQQRMGRHVLGLNAAPEGTVANSLPIALTYSELRWMHQQSRWDMARLRLLGRVLGTAAASTAAVDASGDAGSPAYAVIRGLKKAHDNTATPQPWNWYTATAALVDEIDAGAPETVRLRPFLNMGGGVLPSLIGSAET
jgi:hypothetical protein